MRLAFGALLLISLNIAGAEPPLRFVVPDSWAMPMTQLERGHPTQGILHDVMVSLATQVGMPAEFHVLPRARVQHAMEHGEVDICLLYTSPSPRDRTRSRMPSSA